MAWGIALLAVSGIAILVQLLALDRQRRLFLSDPQRRRFFLGYMDRRSVQTAASPAPSSGAGRIAPADVMISSAESTAAQIPSERGTAHRATDADEAVVYVDATGECTFANQAARQLLRWNTGQLALRDVLAGGRGESEALMKSLARRGLIEQHSSALAGPSGAPLEISAVAVRDRDDNLWGAALFIRGAAGGAAVAGRSRRGSSRR